VGKTYFHFMVAFHNRHQPADSDYHGSDASHLPLLLRDGDNRTRSRRQGDYERGGGKPGERRARGGGGGRGAARAGTPALPVEARGGHRHRHCHFPTAANIRDHGATRGTTSAEGVGGARAPQHRRTPSTRGPSTPLCHTS